MAIIHDTTMSPGKLELLTAWLPAQSWYLGGGYKPALAKAGGSGDRVTAYQVPMTYRAQPLAGADGALIGTSEHGVLGHRWIYDGTRDPVLMAQLIALLQGTAEPQAQSVSSTPDPTVTVQRAEAAGANGARPGQLTMRVNRILSPGGEAGQLGLSAPWRLPDGTQVRGILATAEHVTGPRSSDH